MIRRLISLLLVLAMLAQGADAHALAVASAQVRGADEAARALAYKRLFEERLSPVYGGKGAWDSILERLAARIGFKTPAQSVRLSIRDVWAPFLAANAALVDRGNGLVARDLGERGALTLETRNTLTELSSQFILPASLEFYLRQRAAAIDGPVIVRSSGRTEDSYERNLAGVLTSAARGSEGEVVQAARDVLKDAVEKIWVREHDPSVAEGLGRTLTAEKGIGLVIQSFLSFDASGTAMTDLYGHVSVEAVIGDASTAVMPIHANVVQFLFDKSSGEFEYNPTFLTSPHTIRLKGASYSVEEDAAALAAVVDSYPKIGGAFSPVTREAALELRRVVTALEDEIGRPLDVEWGVLDGELYIVQMRPIIGDFKKPLVEPSAHLAGATAVARTPVALGQTGSEGFTGPLVLFERGLDHALVERFEAELGRDYIRLQRDVATEVDLDHSHAKVLVDVSQGSRQAHNINRITDKISSGAFCYANGPALREGLGQLDFVPHPSIRGVWLARQEVTYFADGLRGAFYVVGSSTSVIASPESLSVIARSPEGTTKQSRLGLFSEKPSHPTPLALDHIPESSLTPRQKALMSFHERVKDIWFERHDAPCFGIDYNVALLRIIDETNVAGSLTEKEQELIGGFLRSGVGDGRLERVRIDLFSGKISETDLAAIQPRIALFEEALNFPLYPETWESEWMARYRQVLQIADVPRLIAAERESDTRRSEHSRYRIFYITAHSPQRNFVRQVKRHLPECELIEVGYNSASGMGYELSRLDYDVDLFYMHLRGAFLTTEELKEILAKIRTRNPDARIFIEGFGTMSVDFELFQERYGKVEVQMEMEHGALWRAAQEGFAAWQASQAAQQAAQQSASAPQTVIARSPEGATKQSHDPSVDLSSVTKFRMLYIDDDAEIRATRMREFSDGLGLAAIASDRLANDEYEIAFAASAEEAIALLDREAFDYVAMDWHIKHAGSGKNAVPDALHRKIIEKRIPQVDVESMPEYRTAPQRMYPGFVTGSFPSDYDEDGSGEARVGRIKEVQSQLSRKRPIALADEEFAAPEEVRIKKTIVGLTEERHLERERLPGGFLYEVASIAVSPDGTRFVTGSDNHGTDVSLWDAATGELIRVFSGHTDRVSTVAFSPDGKRILSGSQDGSVRMWNGATGALIWTKTGRNEPEAAAFSPSGKRVAVRRGGWTEVRDAKTGEQIGDTVWEGRSTGVIAFSPNGKRIVTDTGDSAAAVVDLKTRKAVSEFRGHDLDVSAAAFSPDGKTVATGSNDETVRLWDPATGVEHRLFEPDDGEILSLAFSPDGRYLAVGTTRYKVLIYDVASGSLLRSEYCTGGAEYLAFGSDGEYIYAATDGSDVVVWKVVYGEAVAPADEGGSAADLRAKSPSDPFVIVIVEDNPPTIDYLGRHLTAELGLQRDAEGRLVGNGYELYLFHSGRDAQYLIPEVPTDLLITDWRAEDVPILVSKAHRKGVRRIAISGAMEGAEEASKRYPNIPFIDCQKSGGDLERTGATFARLIKESRAEEMKGRLGHSSGMPSHPGPMALDKGQEIAGREKPVSADPALVAKFRDMIRAGLTGEAFDQPYTLPPYVAAQVIAIKLLDSMNRSGRAAAIVAALSQVNHSKSYLQREMNENEFRIDDLAALQPGLAALAEALADPTLPSRDDDAYIAHLHNVCWLAEGYAALTGKGPAEAQPKRPVPDGVFRLLLVNDGAAELRGQESALLRSLDRDRYEIVCAGSVGEALEALGTTEFDTIVTDIAMPGFDNLRPVLETSPRVILLSGNLTDSAAGLRAGGAIYIDSGDLIEMAVPLIKRWRDEKMKEHRSVQATPSPKTRILLIDDEVDVVGSFINLMSGYLGYEDYEWNTLDPTSESLDLAAMGAYDIVIVDLSNDNGVISRGTVAGLVDRVPTVIIRTGYSWYEVEDHLGAATLEKVEYFSSMSAPSEIAECIKTAREEQAKVARESTDHRPQTIEKEEVRQLEQEPEKPGKFKILILDDTKIYGVSVQSLMERECGEDYEISYAGKPDEARRALRDHAPDLAIVDLQFAQDWGVDRSDVLAGVPHIIILSGDSKGYIEERLSRDNSYEGIRERAIAFERGPGSADAKQFAEIAKRAREASRVSLEKEEARLPAPVQPWPKLRVLILQDDDNIMTSLKHVYSHALALEDTGGGVYSGDDYEIVFVSTDEAAAATIRSSSFDRIILDWTLHGIGFSYPRWTIEAILERGLDCVDIMTGYDDWLGRASARQHGLSGEIFVSSWGDPEWLERIKRQRDEQKRDYLARQELLVAMAERREISSQKTKLLVVDDDPEMLEFIESVFDEKLSPDDYEIVYVRADGDQEDLINKTSADIIIIDINIPEFAWIRDTLLSVDALFLQSAYDEDDARDLVGDDLFDRATYIGKPYFPDKQLVSLVKMAREAQRKARANATEEGQREGEIASLAPNQTRQAPVPEEPEWSGFSPKSPDLARNDGVKKAPAQRAGVDGLSAEDQRSSMDGLSGGKSSPREKPNPREASSPITRVLIAQDDPERVYKAVRYFTDELGLQAASEGHVIRKGRNWYQFVFPGNDRVIRLASDEYEFVFVGTMAEAVAAIDQGGAFDLVITDWALSDVSDRVMGPEDLVKRMRALGMRDLAIWTGGEANHYLAKAHYGDMHLYNTDALDDDVELIKILRDRKTRELSSDQEHAEKSEIASLARNQTEELARNDGAERSTMNDKRMTASDKKTIFVIDNAGGDCSRLAGYLRARYGDGCRTHRCSSMFDLTTELGKATPDIVVTNTTLMADGRRGDEDLATIIRTVRERAPRAKMIVATEEAARLKLEDYKEEGVIAIVEKPLHFGDVADVIDGTYDEKRAASRLVFAGDEAAYLARASGAAAAQITEKREVLVWDGYTTSGEVRTQMEKRTREAPYGVSFYGIEELTDEICARGDRDDYVAILPHHLAVNKKLMDRILASHARVIFVDLFGSALGADEVLPLDVLIHAGIAYLNDDSALFTKLFRLITGDKAMREVFVPAVKRDPSLFSILIHPATIHSYELRRKVHEHMAQTLVMA